MSELMGMCKVRERSFGLESEGGRGCALFVQMPKGCAKQASKRVAQTLPPLVNPYQAMRQ